MTPFEVWTGEKHNVDHLHAFGCTAYAHIAKDERKKLDSKVRKCILLGYGNETKGYRLYDPIQLRVIHSRDVQFNESTRGIEKEKIENKEQRFISLNNSHEEEHALEEEEIAAGQPVEAEETHNEPADVVESETVTRRLTRERTQPDRYGIWVNAAAAQNKELVTVAEALSGSEKEQWRNAMEQEMKSLYLNDVWDLVELPKRSQVVGNKWVFRKKLKADGSVERYKARLVAQGFSQREGVDYDETFSPVIRFESLRTLIALATQKGLKLHQMDVTATFLNGQLEQQVYMKQPEGFIVQGKENLVCKLKHSIY